jgi:transcription initiation factor TFIID subunit 1
LEKNQERRHKREKQKKMVQKTTGQAGNDNGGEGSPEPTIEKGTGTTRKCANCGQVGHIKTNKKCDKCNKHAHLSQMLASREQLPHPAARHLTR